MKKVLLVFICLYTQIAFGQNIVDTRTASLVGSPDYDLEGTAYLELYDDNSLILRFADDYLTETDVYDVHVFLTNDNDYSAPIDTTGLLLVENIGRFGGLNYSSGPMSFDLPPGTGINDYQYIIFICVRFGQLHWGDGVFGPSMPTNVSPLEASNEIAVTAYPNPSRSGFVEIQFQQPQQNALIEVLSINGKLLSSERIFNSKQRVVELEEPGIYFIRLTTDTGSTVKKVIRL